MEPNQLQDEAVDLCLDPGNRIVAVTGAAGTGKTTTIKRVAKALQDAGISYAVAAPTGKAAKRIQEATGLEAKTVHRLLEYPYPGERDPQTGQPLSTSDPKRDSHNPVDEKVIIVDEYAMVGHELNRNLIDALPRGGRLLVFGDVNQLPPIEEPGLKQDKSPFQQHLERCSITLEKVFRQNENSGLLFSAGNIAKGRFPVQAADFKMIPTEFQIRRLEEFVLEMQDEHGIDYKNIRNQIITPTRKTWCGTNTINLKLKTILNPEAIMSLELPRDPWEAKNIVSVSIGDKVVITENMYDLRDYNDRFEDVDDPQSFIPTPPSKYVFNGETGTITEITDDFIFIDVGDRIIEVPAVQQEFNFYKSSYYEKFPYKKIDLAYALTTHKVQGSEYDHVAYVMSKSSMFMLERKNYYTAVTRAKKTATVIADHFALKLALRASVPQRKKVKAHE